MKIGTSHPRQAQAAQLEDEQAGAQQDSRAELLHSTCRVRDPGAGSQSSTGPLGNNGFKILVFYGGAPR